MTTLAHRIFRLQGTLNFLLDGSGQAGFRIYTAPQRALETDSIGSATLLTTLYLDPTVGEMVGDELLLEATDVAFNVATGIPAWGTYFNRNGVDGGDVTVSAPGDGGQIEIEVDTVTGQIYAGGATGLVNGKFTA